MMTSESVPCPQCQAPLTLVPERKFCQCVYCGAKFAIHLPDGRTPRLEYLDAVLSTPAGKTVLRDAQDRLADLEMTLADAEDDVETTRVELEDAKSAYQEMRARLRAAIAPLQNMTYVAGLLAVLAAFAALFVFKRPQRIPGGVIAVLLAATGWAWHREWQDNEGHAKAAGEVARDAMDDAEVELRVALARLEDGILERDLLQQHILPAQAPVVEK
jgi:uncharacterized coiled-coil protein SlyX